MKELELHDKLMMLLLQNKILDDDKAKINEYIQDISMNWEMFLGRVAFNRVNGMVHKNLKEFHGVPREIKLALDMLYNAQIEKLVAQRKAINEVSKAFCENNVKHAFLKGSVLNTVVYPEGTRISNDTDILVSPSQINMVEKLLVSLGFVQGKYDKATDTIEKASLSRKLFLRMNTHEVQSFSRLEDSRFLHVNTMDINFKLSANDDINITEFLLDNVITINRNGVCLKSLDWDYFIVQLSSHLYREARLATKIISGADMHFYKFYDFYMLFNSSDIVFDFAHVVKIATETNQLEAVYYALYAVNQLFPGTISNDIFEKFVFEKYDFIDEYIGIQDGYQIYHWDCSFLERIFDYKRRLTINENVNKASDEFSQHLFSM